MNETLSSMWQRKIETSVKGKGYFPEKAEKAAPNHRSKSRCPRKPKENLKENARKQSKIKRNQENPRNQK